MKTRLLPFWIVLLLSLVITDLSAQFGSLRRKVQQKLEKKIEDKIVDEVSTRIADRAFRPIDKAMDDWLKENYDADTTSTGEIDWEKFNSKYQDILSSLSQSYELPERYTFDIQLDVDIKDYEGKKHQSQILLTTSDIIFGMAQMPAKDETQTVVLDAQKNLMAIYQETKDGKTVQALPNALSLASSIGSEQFTDEMMYEISATGKKKTFVGYECLEYKGENKEEIVRFYVAQDFPLSWEDTYGQFVMTYYPRSYAEMSQKIQGMILYSEAQRKDNKKKKSSWEVKKVNFEPFTIDNSEWEITSLGANQE